MARTALVTGASAGLGVEFARQLAARRYDLAITARRVERLDAVAEEIRRDHGVQVTTIASDLSEPEAPAALQEALATAGIDVDVLVNNAGASGPDLIEDRNWGNQMAFLHLMMVSCAHLCHLFIPGMLERGFGRVINVSSVAGRIPRAGDTNYGPTKAYLIALSENLHLTTKLRGVNVCALCPGFTHTEFHETGNLMDVKRSTPGFIWYDAATVVREGLVAVERGKPVQVSGRLYRVADPFLQSVWTRRLFRIPRRPAAD